MICESCERGEHYGCGMQTWCECECDGPYDVPYEPEFDCHMDKHGDCGLAGSEECDFETLSISLRHFGCDATLPLTDRLAMWMVEKMIDRRARLEIVGCRDIDGDISWCARSFDLDGLPLARQYCETMREALVFAAAEWIQAQGGSRRRREMTLTSNEMFEAILSLDSNAHLAFSTATGKWFVNSNLMLADGTFLRGVTEHHVSPDHAICAYFDRITNPSLGRVVESDGKYFEWARFMWRRVTPRWLLTDVNLR